MDRKIRIGAVSYLNTKPLIYGLESEDIRHEIELFMDYPAHVAAMLEDDRIDIGLVPVAIIPDLEESHVVTDYCIGCNGAVESVALFSEVPLEEVDTILLDYQSRTSVMLARILMKEFWKKQVNWVNSHEEGYRHEIHHRTAGLVIGDRAFSQKKESRYMYDLGQAWKDFTGLPFVFAAWVANKSIPAGFIEKFSCANAAGLSSLASVVAREKDPPTDLMHYYTNNISYHLDAEKRKGLDCFLAKLKTLDQ